jgi:hypothetical protein
MLTRDATAAEAERKEEEEQHLIATMSQRRRAVREINAGGTRSGRERRREKGEKHYYCRGIGCQ